MNNLPLNVRKFMPLMQQRIVANSEEFAEIVEQLENELQQIPEYYDETETVFAHFFFRDCDWFVLNWDRENELIFCYAIINGDLEMSELGDAYLPELLNSQIPIELDFHWEKKSLAQAKYKKYPNYFPKPQ